MKIAYCHTSLSASAGMERVLTTKINYWVSRGHETHVILRASKHKPYFPLDERVNVHFIGELNNKLYRKRLNDILMLIRPDYTVSMFGSEAQFLYAFRDGSRKILEFHFTRYYLTHLIHGIRNLRFRWLHLLKAKYMEWRDSRIVKKYDTVVVLTKRDKMLWGNPTNMKVIPNPLSFICEEQTDYNNKKIVAMGRYIAQKGFDLLIEAFSKIASKHPNWKLEIYGEGRDKVYLQSLIYHYNLHEQVVLLPSTDDVSSVMCSASFFVFPSRYEGFGLVLTEAMECGLPCISFDCECGPADIIEEDVTGKLVATGDVAQLANTMSELMSKPSEIIRMGLNAKQSVCRFSVTNVMKLWEDVCS